MVPRNFAPTRRGYRAREGRGRRTRRRDARSLDRVDDSRVGRRVARAGVRRARAIPARTRSLSADFACQKRRSSHDFSSGTTTIYDVVDDGRAGSRQLPPRPPRSFRRGPSRPPRHSSRPVVARVAIHRGRERVSFLSARRVGGGATRRGRARRGCPRATPNPTTPGGTRVVARVRPSLFPPSDQPGTFPRGRYGPARFRPERFGGARRPDARVRRAPRRGRHERPHARPQRLRRRFPVALAPRDARARRPATERRVVVGTPPDALEAEARGRRPLARDRRPRRARRGRPSTPRRHRRRFVLRVVRPRRRRRRRRRLERRRIRRSRRPRRGGS